MGGVERLQKGRGFTLVEMLVVTAIIGVLVAILLPSLRSAVESAYSVSCLNNQKQVGVAVYSYANDFRNIIPGSQTRNYNYVTKTNENYVNWPTFYQGGDYPDYVSSAKILMCTKNISGCYGMYWLMHSSQMTTYAAYLNDNPYSNYNCYYKISLLPNPSNLVLFGCSSYASQSRNGTNRIVATIFWGPEQGLWMAHGNANGLYADGHAKSCNADDLLDAANNRKVNDTNYLGGIRVWKDVDLNPVRF